MPRPRCRYVLAAGALIIAVLVGSATNVTAGIVVLVILLGSVVLA